MEEFVNNNILKKVVYKDNNVDKAVFGYVVSEDETFITILRKDGTKQTVGRRFIITIEEVDR